MAKTDSNPFAAAGAVVAPATAPESAPVAPAAPTAPAPATVAAPPAPPATPPPEIKVEVTGLIRMARTAEDANGGPLTADVHPDEVSNYSNAGFRIVKE